MHLTRIPSDLNVEQLLSYLPEGECKVVMRGMHKRNAYNDITDIEENADGTMTVGIGRKSLYNALPEYMFHPIDRFDNLPRLEEKEKFAEQLEEQEREKENAYRFFLPLDLLLLRMRLEARASLLEYVESDKVMTDMLADRLTEEQRGNRFIRQALPFLPQCKRIRGDRTLMACLLRKVFLDEGMAIDVESEDGRFTDTHPRYACQVGGAVGSCFVGNEFTETVQTYHMHYWSDEACDSGFLAFVDEMEVFRQFLQDYFMSVEEAIRFDICKDEAPLRLSSGDVIYNYYLNYNTNI